MDIYLPIASMSINIFLLIGLGGLVGFLSGLFGVGGGFLLTPLLIFSGIPPTVAAASDSNQIVAAASSGAYAHSRMGNVDFKMGIIILIGGVVGGSIGVQIIKVLRVMGNVDFVIKLIYVIMLGTIGTFMFFESLSALKRSKARGGEETHPHEPRESGVRKLAAKLPLQMHFEKSRMTTSAIFPFVLGTAVGDLSGYHGGRRGIRRGPGHDLYPGDADHRGHRYRFVSNCADLCQCDGPTGHPQSYGGPGFGDPALYRFHYRGPNRGQG